MAVRVTSFLRRVGASLAVRLLVIVRTFIASKRAVSTVEYALITLAVIGIVAGGVATLTGQFDTLFDSLGNRLSEVIASVDGVTPP